ncbi:MAG: hypothetical protein OJF51_004786 [Nitrospira sp.]|nr:MAG: hypothetical protein OJF51_004786 [Nitrospira sp.]
MSSPPYDVSSCSSLVDWEVPQIKRRLDRDRMDSVLTLMH